MNQIRARLRVGPDHRVPGTVPDGVPPGEHEAIITVSPVSARQKATRPFNMDDLPLIYLAPWPEGVTLTREEIYGDDGR